MDGLHSIISTAISNLAKIPLWTKTILVLLHKNSDRKKHSLYDCFLVVSNIKLFIALGYTSAVNKTNA